jgi:hypothetical protein
MTVKKNASRRSSNSDLARVDSHVVKPEEYEELPELTDEMPAHAKVNKGGRPVSKNPRKLISLRLPPPHHFGLATTAQDISKPRRKRWGFVYFWRSAAVSSNLPPGSWSRATHTKSP